MVFALHPRVGEYIVMFANRDRHIGSASLSMANLRQVEQEARGGTRPAYRDRMGCVHFGETPEEARRNADMANAAYD